MAKEDCEIEYLDEDEDIIQQFVQNAPVVGKKLTTTIHPADSPNVPPDAGSDDHDDDEDTDSLLVARKRSDIIRKLKSDDDSDYDPSEEFRQTMKKRRKSPKNLQPNVQVLKVSGTPLLLQDKKPEEKLGSKFDLHERRKRGIRIPDFEDPLCLPVKAICNSAYDLQKLKNWNKICLEHYKKSFVPFRPSGDPVISSSRTTVFRKVRNRATGQLHTTVWNKIQIKDSNSKENSEVHQHTMPLFHEKIVLKPFVLAKNAPRSFSHKHEILLTKESNKDEELLVAYNPRNAVTAVYKEYQQNDAALAEGEDKKPQRLVIKEATCNKICAPCYQNSWRGVRKRDQTSIQCVICKRNYVSVYNVLAHLKAHHTHDEVRRHKTALTQSLADVVAYHYKCRICQETFLSIKLLRTHVAKHKGDDLFHCEIGNHIAQ